MRAHWLVAVALLVVYSSPVPAEIGVVELDSAGPYVFGIIDDPDPTGMIWRRHTPVGSVDRVVLNEQGEANGDGNPSVLYNSVTGTPIVAWARNSADGFDVVLSRFVDGAWSDPLVLAGSAADELDPFLVLDEGNGDVHLLYWVDDGLPRVVHRWASADLSDWTTPQVVSGPAEIAARPAGTMLAGVLRVVYESHTGSLGGTPKLVVLATESGSGFTFETLGTSDHPSPIWPQIHSRPGRFWAEWLDDGGSMGWTREGTGGTWEPLQIEPYATTEERDYFVRGRIRVRAGE